MSVSNPQAEEIASLKGKIEGYEAELLSLQGPGSKEERLSTKALITESRKTLNTILAQQTDVRDSSGMSWNVQKFDVFGHGIGLAQLAVAVVGLGSLVAGGGIFVVKHHQRATNKFFKSLMSISKDELSKIRYEVLPRGQMFVGIPKLPFKKLNLRDSDRSVALKGDNRSGKTIFLAHTILNDMFPWWYRYFFPPRGLFLTGSQESETIHAWLKSQIVATEKDNPWASMMDLLSQRRNEQRVRLLLQTVFKSNLPRFLQPQPSIIVVDQAEELMKAYRADFLVCFYNLAKKGRDTDLFRLVMVINTDNAEKALELMNGGNMFHVIEAPKVSREAVVQRYGEDFALIFDDCDSCIGVALDYQGDKKRGDLTPKEYLAMKKEKYSRDNCLAVEITRDEFMKAGEHSNPKY